MNLNRKSGILLHPTSLPGAGGIGTLGQASFDFIDWLSNSGTKLWQVLPLGPTGYGDSPYQPFSAFALNPLLIDMEGLFEQGWAQAEDVKVPDYIKPEGNVDFGSVVWWKKTALKNICKKIIDSGLKKIKILILNRGGVEYEDFSRFARCRYRLCRRRSCRRVLSQIERSDAEMQRKALQAKVKCA